MWLPDFMFCLDQVSKLNEKISVFVVNSAMLGSKICEGFCRGKDTPRGFPWQIQGVFPLCFFIFIFITNPWSKHSHRKSNNYVPCITNMHYILFLEYQNPSLSWNGWVTEVCSFIWLLICILHHLTTSSHAEQTKSSLSLWSWHGATINKARERERGRERRVGAHLLFDFDAMFWILDWWSKNEKKKKKKARKGQEKRERTGKENEVKQAELSDILVRLCECYKGERIFHKKGSKFEYKGVQVLIPFKFCFP